MSAVMNPIFNLPDVQQFLKLLKVPEVQIVFNLMVENAITLSDMNILKRLTELEVQTGINDPGDEDHPITLPERIDQLAESIDNKTVQETIIEPTQKTKNERRAHHFMESPPIGLVAKEGIVIKSKVWRHWVRTLPEELKTKSFQNIRKLKIDLFNLLEKLFPDRVYLKQDKTGLKEWKLIIKSVT